jgi:hypothetical protein
MGSLTDCTGPIAAPDPAVEQRDLDGRWVPAESQAINPERFPVRIFSQGQIAAVAGTGAKHYSMSSMPPPAWAT